MNQKEIKSLRQHGSRQALHMVHMSCLAECGLFTGWCALNTCKANSGANLTSIRAEWSVEQTRLLLGLSGEELGVGEQVPGSAQLSHPWCARSPEIPVSCQQGQYQLPTGAGSDFCSSGAGDGEPCVQPLSLHPCPERHVLCSWMGWRQTLYPAVFQRTS